MSEEDVERYENVYEGFNLLRYIIYSYYHNYEVSKEFYEHIISYMFPVLRNYIKCNPTCKKYEHTYIYRLSKNYETLTEKDKSRIIGLYIGIAKYSIMRVVKFDYGAMEAIAHMVSLMHSSIKISKVVETIVGCTAIV
jgi:hypothetical protein